MDGEEGMISFEFEIWLGVIDVYRDGGMSIYGNYMSIYSYFRMELEL
jgi:hypothetical protein